MIKKDELVLYHIEKRDPDKIYNYAMQVSRERQSQSEGINNQSQKEPEHMLPKSHKDFLNIDLLESIIPTPRIQPESVITAEQAVPHLGILIESKEKESLDETLDCANPLFDVVPTPDIAPIPKGLEHVECSHPMGLSGLPESMLQLFYPAASQIQNSLSFGEYQQLAQRTNVSTECISTVTKHLDCTLEELSSLLSAVKIEWAIDVTLARKNLQQIHTILAMSYLLSGLSGEVGEIHEKYKKYIRSHFPSIEEWDILKQGIVKEMGDVLWYLASLAEHLGVRLEDVAQQNLDKLKSRQKRDKLHGDGDER